MRRFVICLMLAATMIFTAVPVFADVEKTVKGNDLVIVDEADLFTSGEESQLASEMKSLCEYGDTILYTLDENPYSTQSAADQILSAYGYSGVVFLIDLDNREIYLYTTYDALPAGHCYSITDNVYEMAADGDFYGCASEVFVESEAVLQGQRIAQPMKHIDNALLAIIIAMIINFLAISFSTGKKKASSQELAGNAIASIMIASPNLIVTGHRKVHHQSSSSGGGGGGFSGGGGGGHGGGHSF